MNKTPDVSIVMPVYNSDRFLDKAIDSVLQQSFQNFELIIINDGSSDFSEDIILEHQKLDSRITYIKQQNSGVAITRNVGMDKAQGKYIYFMDSDDFIEKDLIEDNFVIAEKNNADLVVFGTKILKSEKAQKIIRNKKNEVFKSNLEFRDRYFCLSKENDFNSVWNKFYNTNFLKKKKFRFVNIKIGEDAIFNYHIYLQVKTLVILNRVYYNYNFFREDSAMNSFDKNRIVELFRIIDLEDSLYNKWEIGNEYNLETKKVHAVFSQIKLIRKLDNKKIYFLEFFRLNSVKEAIRFNKMYPLELNVLLKKIIITFFSKRYGE